MPFKEEEQIIKAWKPKPLVPPTNNDEFSKGDNITEIWGSVESRPGKHIVINNVKYLNLATNNYLGLVDDPALDKEAERCIRKYGVGSCGPRGFYGTVGTCLFMYICGRLKRLISRKIAKQRIKLLADNWHVLFKSFV